MFVSVYRIIKSAFQDFWRNFWLSLVTISILSLALISINILLVLNVLGNVALTTVEERIAVSVYLKPGTSDEVVGSIKSYLYSQPQVADVQVTSADEALEALRRRNPDNSTIQEAVDELDGNPLGPSLAIRAKNTSQYTSIMQSLDNPTVAPYVEEKNFEDHKNLIARIRSIADKGQRTAMAISGLFVIISLLIVWNSIRIIIYTHREEIGIMRLVGASSWFIRMPYVLSAIMYALLATIITAIVVFPLAGAIGPSIRNFFDGSQFDLLGFYQHNAIGIFGTEFLIAAFLTMVTSGLAVGRYLKK